MDACLDTCLLDLLLGSLALSGLEHAEGWKDGSDVVGSVFRSYVGVDADLFDGESRVDSLGGVDYVLLESDWGHLAVCFHCLLEDFEFEELLKSCSIHFFALLGFSNRCLL